MPIVMPQRRLHKAYIPFSNCDNFKNKKIKYKIKPSKNTLRLFVVFQKKTQRYFQLIFAFFIEHRNPFSSISE